MEVTWNYGLPQMLIFFVRKVGFFHQRKKLLGICCPERFVWTTGIVFSSPKFGESVETSLLFNNLFNKTMRLHNFVAVIRI